MGDTSANNKEAGQRFFRMRKAARLSQSDVAAKVGGTRQMVSAWEQGKSMPCARRLTILCELYGCLPIELLTGANPATAASAVEAMRVELQAEATAVAKPWPARILGRIFDRVGPEDPYHLGPVAGPEDHLAPVPIPKFPKLKPL